MDAGVLIVFGLVYAGMMLGRVPGLALDRTGIALLGAIGLLAMGRLDAQQAWDAVDVPTISLLLGLMVVSAQFRLGGFYAHVTRRLSALTIGPRLFLAGVIGLAGFLSALLANDIVCLAMTPVLVEGCGRRHWDPVPFLLALACAANVGSAATLIGNPQNMLIGQSLDLSFGRYALDAAMPVALGLVSVWLVIARLYRSRWQKPGASSCEAEAPPFSLWQTLKGMGVLGCLVTAFLLALWPRDVMALAAAGVLLTSRHMASRKILALVDWQLLVLFAGLFVVNGAFQSSGMLDGLLRSLRGAGIDPSQPAWLFGITVILSNLVSNVPATMLLLPVATHPQAGLILALSSTLAGNLILVGSIANLIVVGQAEQCGVRISWWAHARVGIPVTLLTLAISALWLWAAV